MWLSTKKNIYIRSEPQSSFSIHVLIFGLLCILQFKDKYQTWKQQFYISSKRLSGDHTYSVVRNLGLYDMEANDNKKEWVQT